MWVFAFWVVRHYDWCPICQTRVANTGGVLCARCQGSVEIELERLLKEQG